MIPGRDLEQPADVKVLERLGHDRLVGGNDEHHQVDAAYAGEHVPDEPLMPRHVHEGEVKSADLEVREPEVDGDASRLLLLQPIRIGPVSARTSALFP